MPNAPLPTGVDIEYETFGRDDAPALLLISGWGAQMVSWHDDFCRAAAARGYRAIRFDNRDVGLSSKIEDGSSYALEDMADDAVGLMDHLGIARAHIMGASMGGMIAQVVAIRHPSRVLTLTSIMSNTGAPGVGGASEAAIAQMNSKPAASPEERIENSVASCRVTWGDTVEFPFDEELARWRAEVSEARSFYPIGWLRQGMAMQATGDRTEALHAVRVPTLVIHGDNDSLVHVSGGEATAAAIPGAELLIIEGMGHVVDRRATDLVLDAFQQLAATAAPASTN